MLKTATLYRILFKSVGKYSIIKRPLLISNPHFISIGNKVFIRNGVRLEVVIHNQQKNPELSIDDNTNIEQNVHIVCHSKIKIGANVSITGNCCIVDVTHPYEDVNDRRKIGYRILNEDSFVEIGDGSFIGYGSTILPNVKIGKYVVVGANSVVIHDIPDYSVVAGMPAKVIKQYNHEQGKWINV
ncbi:acyltransferase [Calothrix sp. FACHB-1219]|nr:acyltransferase [Calothrix sp. FACHB-168]MBD2215734.1 acyltransferase [Calothrix sp. FACHB-1219]